jgi:hypothetical protein
MAKRPPKKPPLSIAPESWTPKTIDDLPILPDIIQWAKEGITSIEIARRIHRQGFFPQWKESSLAVKVKERVRKIPPSELVVQHHSSAVRRAANTLGNGSERVAALVHQHTAQEQDIQKQREDLEERRVALENQGTFVERICGLIDRLSSDEYASGDPQPAGNSGIDLLLQIKTALAIGDETFNIPAEVALMSRQDALLYLVANSSIMDKLRGHVDAMSKISDSLTKAKAQLTKAQQEQRENVQAQVIIIDKLGLLDENDANETDAAVEAHQQEYIKTAFKGKKDVQKALSNPESRNRVMALVEKLYSRPRLQKAIDACCTPVEPEKPKKKPRGKKKATKKKKKTKAKKGKANKKESK